MSKYKMKYMNDEMLQEMETLFKSEHGTTLTMWSAECARAGVKGCNDGLVKGVLLGIVVGTVAGIGKVIKDKVKHKRLMKELEKNPTEEDDI